MRLRLQEKEVSCPAICVMYANYELEQAWHLFLTCETTIPYWQQSGLRPISEPLLENAESFKKLFFMVCQRLHDSARGQLLLCFFGAYIWKRRNNKQWNAKGRDLRRSSVFQSHLSSPRLVQRQPCVMNPAPIPISPRQSSSCDGPADFIPQMRPKRNRVRPKWLKDYELP